ncbi:hypothetical protein FOZ63_022205, partial [Perkinsus olseni]
SGLRNFRAQNKMKKVVSKVGPCVRHIPLVTGDQHVGLGVALTVIAQQLAEDDIERLKKTFQALDENGDGTLTVQEIKEGMRSLDVSLPADLEEIMKDVDSDGSGAIDYTEFIAATIDKKT